MFMLFWFSLWLSNRKGLVGGLVGWLGGVVGGLGGLWVVVVGVGGGCVGVLVGWCGG